MREIGERIVDQRMQRLGGVTLVPVGHTEPVADLRRVVLTEHKSARADDRLVSQRDQVRRLAFFVRARNELLGIRELVRVRNARGVFRDAAIVGERCNRFSVLEARCAQGQALGLEDGDTGFAISSGRYFFQQLILHAVTDFVPCGHGQVGIDFDVDIREVLESRLPHPQRFHALHLRH